GRCKRSWERQKLVCNLFLTLTSTARARPVRFVHLAGEVGLFHTCHTYGRSPAMPITARQIPQVSPKSPDSVWTPSRENLREVSTPSLHPKWSGSRVSLGSPTWPHTSMARTRNIV